MFPLRPWLSHCLQDRIISLLQAAGGRIQKTQNPDHVHHTPPASNRVRSEVFLPVGRLDWILCLMKKRYWLLAELIFTWTQIGIGFLESSCYRTRIGFGFKICKIGTGLKQSDSARIYYYQRTYVLSLRCCPRSDVQCAAGSILCWV